MKSVFLGQERNIHYVYSDEMIEELKNNAGLISDTVYTRDTLPAVSKDVDYIFSTWGMPALDEDYIKSNLPNLKAVFYSAGSVQNFSRPFLNCGIKVFSAWAANAIPVAEYTVAQIILANKGYMSHALNYTTPSYHKDSSRRKYPGNYGCSVGIIGAGMIGRYVIKLLKNYNLKVMVFDPFLTDDKAAELGVIKADLATIFSECQTISNHVANNAQTVGMLNYDLFKLMKPNAVFINTARGAQVVEPDLIRALTEEPGRFALLDVTAPEPPKENSQLYSLPNCILTPHVAGSFNDEVHRMSEYMYDEFKHLINNEPYNYSVTLEMLKTMA